MLDVLVVDDDFMVAEIHRNSSSGSTASARSASHAMEPKRSTPRETLQTRPDPAGRLPARHDGTRGAASTAHRRRHRRRHHDHRGARTGHRQRSARRRRRRLPDQAVRVRAAAGKTRVLRRPLRRAQVAGGADQIADRLVVREYRPPGPAPRPLPKGLGVETGRLVLAAVREAGEVSAAECADRGGYFAGERPSIPRTLSAGNGCSNSGCSTGPVAPNAAIGRRTDGKLILTSISSMLAVV